MCFFIIVLFISAASCSKEEDRCVEYDLQDEELLNNIKEADSAKYSKINK